MAKYISAADLHEELQKLCHKYNISFGGEGGGFGSEISKISKQLPAADVQEVKHRKWIFKVRLLATDYYECSECRVTQSRLYDYCPSCGAMMDVMDGVENDVETNS